MRRSWIALALLIAFAPPAWAETVETEGFSVKVPPGFRRLAKAEQDGMTFSFPGAGSLGMGDMEIVVFVRGAMPQPEAMVMVMYAEIEGDTGRLTTEAFEKAQTGVRGFVGGADLHMEKRTFQDEFDAIVLSMHLEDIPQAQGVSGDMRFVMVGCGDYLAYVGYVALGDETDAAMIDAEWNAMLGTLHIDPPIDWLFWLLLLGSFSSVFIFVGRVLLKKPPQIIYASDVGASPFPTRDLGARSMDGQPLYGEAAATQAENARQPSRGDEMPQRTPDSLRDPVSQRVERTPLPERGGPSPDGSPGPGLRSTLPASGRWSDQHGKG